MSSLIQEDKLNKFRGQAESEWNMLAAVQASGNGPGSSTHEKCFNDRSILTSSYFLLHARS